MIWVHISYSGIRSSVSICPTFDVAYSMKHNSYFIKSAALTRLGINYIVIGLKTPILELELVFYFLKGIGIGENLIGIFNYFSITFSITSCNF